MRELAVVVGGHTGSKLSEAWQAPHWRQSGPGGLLPPCAAWATDAGPESWRSALGAMDTENGQR